ncbi:MAG: LacI family DNA-binding transcriptional regulator [Spirochaetales bacterium]|nr:LacI family DNA-binding transcriptional regulator [Spirochaetales bacterium]
MIFRWKPVFSAGSFFFIDSIPAIEDNKFGKVGIEENVANLKDVARLAGVSVATVSQALNGKYVNERTREKVLKCAAELKYYPNKSGRTLITGKAATIMLVVINSRGHADIVNESTFFYHIIQGILKVVEKQEHSFLFDVKNWEDADLTEYFTRRVHDRSTDGLIIIPQYVRPYDFLSALGDFPVIFLNASDVTEQLNTVYIDNELGARLIAEHFIKSGYKNIAIIHGPEDHYDGIQRKRSFLATMKSNGIDVPEKSQIYGDYTIESGHRGAALLLETVQPEAIFCANDYMAAGAMRCLKERGLSIPGDVAVAGYDNVELSQAVFPQLTTIDGRMHDLGIALAENLFKVMDTGHSPVNIRLVPQLLKRGTA